MMAGKLPALSLPPPITREAFEALLALEPPSLRASMDPTSASAAAGAFAPLAAPVDVPEERPDLTGPLRVEYTLHPRLSERVFQILADSQVTLGHVILMDSATGRLLAYASTDAERFPPTRAYPAASLIKVVTAAATLHYAPRLADRPCRFVGSPYHLLPSRIDPPQRGREISLRQALATSNNQCFAQLAVHGLGSQTLLDTISRFGFLSEPAPGHPAGRADAGEGRYGLGRLGCGLSGCEITPLHAVQLAGTLADGLLVSPRWIERVQDAYGIEVALPAPPAAVRVMTRSLTARLRGMLVDTTRRGTARKAFRSRRGQPLLGAVQVAGKTGSLSGGDPKGRYEWFVGVAPADAPALAIAVVVVQGEVWWRNASQVAATVLREVFCSEGPCRSEAVHAWLRAAPPAPEALF